LEKIARQDSKERIARKGQPEKISQNRTVRTGQAEKDRKNKIAMTGLPGQDYQDRAGNRTARISQQGQKVKERTARKQLEQDSYNRTASVVASTNTTNIWT
jgi:hypothetical protein